MTKSVYHARRLSAATVLRFLISCTEPFEEHQHSVIMTP
ncbi:hypothetical protein ARMA_0352 [Ardenticatena maritima]|uniref:Uncharacterized protein n=1 Tax=Ardenticatena maritima TaxID=872965 RepID=A0A0M8K7A3_9CHLR|nr:hypothetical protein ARMA_0352 [Ardenticatena maritima]